MLVVCLFSGMFMLVVCLYSGIFWCVVHFIFAVRYNRNKILWSFFGAFFGLFTFIILLLLGKKYFH